MSVDFLRTVNIFLKADNILKNNNNNKKTRFFGVVLCWFFFSFICENGLLRRLEP